MTEDRDARNEPLDAIVVGAGICGIVFLKYAVDRGLRCRVLEKQSEVGGLWTWLPSWQDIQNRKEDFAINDVALQGVRQPQIARHARQWVEDYELAPYIELGCEVTSTSWTGELWRVETNRGLFRARYLIAATGVQNEPWTPKVERTESEVVEMHSSQLERPADLARKRVTVVGGGTSAWDLLELAIKNDADEVHWVHRSIKWFLPTTRSKQDARPNLRELAVVQSVRKSAGAVTAFLRWLLRRRFDRQKLTHVEPQEPFDIRRHQLIPGRASMLQNLDTIARHQSPIRSIRGRQITLENGERFETEILLWGTGYRMNLEYLDLPEYRRIRKLDELLPRLGSLVRSVDYPNLFFIGMSLAESTSATPFFAAIESKSIVSHIRGECEVPKKNVPHIIAHWDLFRHFASFDRSNYLRLWWRIKYFVLALWYALFPSKTVKV